MEKSFNITWVQQGEKMPSGVCPKCQIGELRPSQFFDGVYCSKCKWKWRVSQYPPKGTETPQKPSLGANTGGEILLDEIQELKKHFDIRMDGLAEYLKEHLK